MRKVLPILGLTLVILFIIGFLSFFLHYVLAAPGPLNNDRVVIIPMGSGIKNLSRHLKKKGIVSNAIIFEIAARTIGHGKILHAGEYKFQKRISILEVLSVFHSGKTVVRRLTIPEGFNVHEVRKLLIQVEGLRGNISEPFQEGELLPETYHYSFGDTRNSLVKRIKLTMQSTIKRLWPKREQGLPITKVSQFIILASIVEKETGLNEERRRVAAVFLNRLRLGMPLQSDPTVIYGLTKGRGNLGRPLTRKDLRDSNPFNTYVNKGLPPAPISNPGEESIKAVLNPVESEELYFVANGEGGHFFSKTLKDHNKNVAKWRKSQIDKKVSP